MLKTILIGSCVLVQGVFVKALAGGLIEVRVGNKVFQGKPVNAEKAAWSEADGQSDTTKAFRHEPESRGIPLKHQM